MPYISSQKLAHCTIRPCKPHIKLSSLVNLMLECYLVSIPEVGMHTRIKQTKKDVGLPDVLALV